MNLLQDVRYTLRAMRKAPGFAAVAIITLALAPSTRHHAVARPRPGAPESRARAAKVDPMVALHYE